MTKNLLAPSHPPKNNEKIGKNGGGMQKEKRRFGGISAFFPV